MMLIQNLLHLLNRFFVDHVRVITVKKLLAMRPVQNEKACVPVDRVSKQNHDTRHDDFNLWHGLHHIFELVDILLLDALDGGHGSVQEREPLVNIIMLLRVLASFWLQELLMLLLYIVNLHSITVLQNLNIFLFKHLFRYVHGIAEAGLVENLSRRGKLRRHNLIWRFDILQRFKRLKIRMDTRPERRVVLVIVVAQRRLINYTRLLLVHDLAHV